MFRVGGGGCRSAGAGMRAPSREAARGWGLRRPRKTERTREGSPRLEVMGGSAFCVPDSAPGPAAPRRSRVGDAVPAAGTAGESLRGAAAAAAAAAAVAIWSR